MKKIIFTITPNPALDLSGIVRNIKLNEKAYVFDEQRAPGGNAINAARILSRLKIPVVTSGFLGGSTGDEIKLLLEREKLKHNFIKIGESSRINVTVSNQFDHQQTRLSFPGPCIKGSEKKRLFDLIAKQDNMSILVIGGSLPSGFSPMDIVLIMKLARKRGVETVVDCPGEILQQIIPARPLLIKPNIEEFQTLTRSRVKTIGSVVEKAKGLLSQVQMVCVSSVEGGAVLISQYGSYFGQIPKIKIRSSVGAGDSMVGAMVAQLYKGNVSVDQILRWGLASAAATLGESGTMLGTASEINNLYRQIRIEKV